LRRVPALERCASGTQIVCGHGPQERRGHGPQERRGHGPQDFACVPLESFIFFSWVILPDKSEGNILMEVVTITTGRVYDFEQIVKAQRNNDFILFYDDSRRMAGKIELTDKEKRILDVAPSHISQFVMNKYDNGLFAWVNPSDAKIELGV
jgi:hypothetical protein